MEVHCVLCEVLIEFLCIAECRFISFFKRFIYLKSDRGNTEFINESDIILYVSDSGIAQLYCGDFFRRLIYSNECNKYNRTFKRTRSGAFFRPTSKDTIT